MSRVRRDQDGKAFGELVRRWDRRVLTFLTKATRDPDAAKDLRQEVFLRVFRYGESYNPAFAFSTWLYRIVANVLANWQAKQRRVLAVETPCVGDAGNTSRNPGDCAEAAEEVDLWEKYSATHREGAARLPARPPEAFRGILRGP
ncbi:MAG TPA: hypothetical protein HPP77_02765 [Candidatus Hydrogenedentes bacterium]|nr:hypothetical protein [Candidatus Hydrogenedentota bacterium]